MKTINAPPKHALKATVGIDSIFLQFRGVYKSDVDQFCRGIGLSYKESKRGKHTREWTIFLAGGQSITAVYHFSSKTTTFQIGKLMNYSGKLNDQHEFLQKIMHHYVDKEMQVSGLDFAVDVKEHIASVFLKTNPHLKSKKKVGSTVYFNHKSGTVFIMYNKAEQMQFYSTTLTRFELRLRQKLSQWKVQDFTENRQSLEKLSLKIEGYFKEEIKIHTAKGNTPLTLAMGNVVETIEDFVAFLHGGSLPTIKDHFKVYRAVEARDRFFTWMANNHIKHTKEISIAVKGKKAECLRELGLDHKTFNKAVQFYKGIPNFKISALGQ